MARTICRGGAFALVALWFTVMAVAQDDEAASVSAAQQRTAAAFAAAREVAVHGPAQLPWVNEATMSLPEGFIYVPRPQADQLMDAFGNSYDERFIGLVFPADDANWLVVAEYEHSGHIADDEARDWDTDELLSQLKAGTKEGNKRRREQGIGELEVLGWAEEPSYDPATHRLIWSLAARDTASAPGEPQTINYNTYVLGREGYVTLNLVTDSEAIATDRAAAHTLLAGLAFDPGRTYADFDASTDKVAAYGLAALVAGVAAKKLGLLAAAAAFLVKFGKLIAVAVLGGGAALWKKLRGKPA